MRTSLALGTDAWLMAWVVQRVIAITLETHFVGARWRAGKGCHLVDVGVRGWKTGPGKPTGTGIGKMPKLAAGEALHDKKSL